MKNTYLLFLCFVFCSLSGLFAQTTTTRREPKPYHPPLPVRPPLIVKNSTPSSAVATTTGFSSGINPASSPEISQANSLQDIPVNKYTGTPIVKIPLYGVQEGGKLGVSIGLNYNASGIRGHQLSGWTGLGWDLEGIPMLTRMVRGLPDEGKFEATSLNSSVERKGYYGSSFVGNIGENDDKEPDYYFLNVGGSTLRFTFNSYSQSLFFPDNDIKAFVFTSPSLGSSVVKVFTKFLVLMPDGTVYEFVNENIESTAEVEVEYAQNNQIYPLSYNSSTVKFSHYLKTNAITSAWYCSKITTPEGLTINFKYNKVLYSYYKLADNEDNSACPTSVSKKINRVFVEGSVISTIETSHTVIRFNDGLYYCIDIPHPITLQNQTICTLSVPDREDIEGWTSTPTNGSPAKVLKNIVVYDKSEPTEKMTWSFDYGYFEGTDNSGSDLPSGYSYNGVNPVGHTHKKRLKLTRINYPDGNTTDFTYYGESTNFNFKTRFTYGIDHWGYINGADGNLLGLGLIGKEALYAGCGASREANFSFLRYGSLGKITHSAGSEVFLEYEAHKANNYTNGNADIGGLRIKKMRTKDLLRGTDILKEYDYTTSTGQSSGFLSIQPTYRFIDHDVNYYANSALYEILMAESGRPAVGYSQVGETVYDLTNTTQIGKTISYYDQNENESTLSSLSEVCDFNKSTNELTCKVATTYLLTTFLPKFDYRSGSLIKEETYNQANQKLSEVSMVYTPNNGIKADSMYCEKVVRLNGINEREPYYLRTHKYRLEQTTTKVFGEDGGTPQVSSTEFVYKDEMPQVYKNIYQGKHNQAVKTITTDSYGYVVESLTKYGGDFSFDLDSTLKCVPDCLPQNPCADYCQYWEVTEHVPPLYSEAWHVYNLRRSMRIALPIESITKRNNKTISASYQTYEQGKPAKFYSLRTVPKTNFTEVFFQKNTDQMIKDSGYGEPRSEVLTYNQYGLPVLVEVKGGAKSRIDYDTFNVIPTSKTANYGINDALSTQYFYSKHFQGASKIISPNNLELRYNYRLLDSRLDFIQDKDNNILKKYIYQVKPQ